MDARSLWINHGSIFSREAFERDMGNVDGNVDEVWHSNKAKMSHPPFPVASKAVIHPAITPVKSCKLSTSSTLAC